MLASSEPHVIYFAYNVVALSDIDDLPVLALNLGGLKCSAEFPCLLSTKLLMIKWKVSTKKLLDFLILKGKSQFFYRFIQSITENCAMYIPMDQHYHTNCLISVEVVIAV